MISESFEEADASSQEKLASNSDSGEELGATVSTSTTDGLLLEREFEDPPCLVSASTSTTNGLVLIEPLPLKNPKVEENLAKLIKIRKARRRQRDCLEKFNQEAKLLKSLKSYKVDKGAKRSASPRFTKMSVPPAEHQQEMMLSITSGQQQRKTQNIPGAKQQRMKLAIPRANQRRIMSVPQQNQQRTTNVHPEHDQRMMSHHTEHQQRMMSNPIEHQQRMMSIPAEHQQRMMLNDPMTNLIVNFHNKVPSYCWTETEATDEDSCEEQEIIII